MCVSQCNFRVEEVLIARLAVELLLVFIQSVRRERLLAEQALDAGLVEGSPVRRHEGLGRVDGSRAGRAPRGLRRSRPPSHHCGPRFTTSVVRARYEGTLLDNSDTTFPMLSQIKNLGTSVKPHSHIGPIYVAELRSVDFISY